MLFIVHRLNFLKHETDRTYQRLYPIRHRHPDNRNTFRQPEPFRAVLAKGRAAGLGRLAFCEFKNFNILIFS